MKSEITPTEVDRLCRLQDDVLRKREIKMKKRSMKFLSVLLVLAMVLPLVACEKTEPAQYDVPALMQSILEQVTFADPLDHTPDPATAALYFPDLPENARVELYVGSGYHADEVALITLAGEADAEAARKSVDQHLEQLHAQFANYIPEELGKIDNACVWENGKHILLCITEDMASVKDILNHASDPGYKLPGVQNPTADSTAPSNPTTGAPGDTTAPTDDPQPPVTTPTTVPPQTVDPDVAVRPDGYPAVLSQSGTYHSYAGTSMIRVDNSAFELCGYSDSVAKTYAGLVSKAADALAGETTVYALAIPTAYGVVLPDDIQAQISDYPDQGASIDKVFSYMSSNVVPVRCFDNLMRHRNEYLYFRTDHHWNGTGAYYAYEAFCETKGIAPYTLQQREQVQFGDFLGALYTAVGSDQSLLPADTVNAYKPHAATASMVFYDKDGTEFSWPIISDVTNWKPGSKYSTFAGADNPLAILTNPEVTDGSVCVVVKESYGNALMPYLVDHYSTVYEIDYRYWEGDLVTFAREKGADDLIFANNIMMISTGLLVGGLSDNIQ